MHDDFDEEDFWNYDLLADEAAKSYARGVDKMITASLEWDGMWNGQFINEMDTAHIVNTINWLKKNKPDKVNKIKELEKELATRVNQLITKHEFQITEQDIIELAKQRGIKIPKSGAGVYFNQGGDDVRITEGRLSVKFDTSRTIAPKNKATGVARKAGAKRAKKVRNRV